MITYLIKRIVLISCVCSCVHLAYGQSYKTLNDSIFVIGDTLVLPEIRFSFNAGYMSDPTFTDSVKVIGEFLEGHPNLKIEIIYFTDSRGSEEANLKLSERRAKAVVDYLIYLGIDKLRLSSKGCGENQLIYSNEEILSVKEEELKEKMHNKNMRTEMVIVGIN